MPEIHLNFSGSKGRLDIVAPRGRGPRHFFQLALSLSTPLLVSSGVSWQMEDFEDKEKLHADITRLCSARLGIESDKITERKVALLFVHPVTTASDNNCH